MPGPGELRPQWRETHSALIALVGDRAYKTKKPVALGFLDFRTPAARHAALERELELNRRLAPDVYLDVASVRRGDGTELDRVLVMRRMPEDRRLAHLVAASDGSGVVVADALRRLARLLAAFHARAERGAGISAEAGAVGLRRRWTDNLDELTAYVGTAVRREDHARIGELALAYVDGRGPLFARRGAAGDYVDGHGDLTAEDVFCLDDGPRALDCIEFDDRLRYVDVLDDAAFLAMDLEHLGRPDLARLFLAAYGEYSAVAAPPSLQHHYVAYRALVRAKVACIRAAQGGSAEQPVIDAYVAQARRHLEAGQVRLVLVGGAPGTGKTSVAGALADELGAVLLSSDRIRLDLGAAVAHRYDDAGRARVYGELLTRAARALAHGESVVADATWSSTAQRDLATACARATRSALVCFECHTPTELAVRRAERRRAAGTDASEAGGRVAALLARERAPWPGAVPVDTSGSVQEALASMRPALPPVY